jgi:hypothetical protein
MPRKNSPNDIQALEDLNQLDLLVVDKRLGQRSSAKKGRRNRHYEKQFIRNALAHTACIASAPSRQPRPTTQQRGECAVAGG